MANIMKITDGCGKSWFYIVDHGHITAGIEKKMDTCKVFHVINPELTGVNVSIEARAQRVRVEVNSSNKCYVKASYGGSFVERVYYSLSEALVAAGATPKTRNDSPTTYEGGWCYEVGEAQVAVFHLEGSCIEQRLLGA